jgi:mannitol/fructose-specific phosphotransferase system IIA component (Ntr-type)/nucleotide-binding universal stress UspA family protein
MFTPKQSRVVIWVSDPGMEEVLIRNAALIAQARVAGMEVVHAAPHLGSGRDTSEGDSACNTRIADEAGEKFAPHEPCDLFVTNWENDAERMQAFLRFVMDANAEALVFKECRDEPVRRLVVPIGDGVRAMEQMWIARQLARAWGAPVHGLRIVPRAAGLPLGNPMAETHFNHIRELARLEAGMMGLKPTIEVRFADSVAEAVVSEACLGDFLVLGAPNYWRMSQHFHKSIPDEVVRSVPCSAVMVVGKRAKVRTLRQIFWDQTVCVNLKPRDKAEVFAMLVDSLVDARQVPAGLRDDILSTVIERDRLRPSAVGCETAFPRTTVPGLTEIVGCLGICPRGVRFDMEDEQPTKFVFLLLTPSDFHGEYLSTLAKIARCMIHPDVRARLLQCSTPTEVAFLLDGE